MTFLTRLYTHAVWLCVLACALPFKPHRSCCTLSAYMHTLALVLTHGRVLGEGEKAPTFNMPAGVKAVDAVSMSVCVCVCGGG